MHHFTPHAVAASLALLGTASAQQGSISQIGGNDFIDAEALVATAIGASFNGMLGVSVDTAGHYYVTARRDMTANPHGFFEFDANGAFVASYNQPTGTALSAWGIRDLALDGTTNVIYGGLEGDTIYAFDATTKIWDASKDVTVTGAMVGGTI